MDRILIVDSSVQNTDLMSECLSSSGYEIITAESGFNALAKVELFNPDLVILDADLNDISGYDVCKNIKEKKETKYVLVLIMSISETKDARIRSVQVGADDFMEKTFDATLLISKTKSLLHLKYLSDQLKQKYIELEEKNSILEFQLKMGRRVQRTILQKVNFEFNGVTFLSKYLPAMDIGGDFYDVLQIDSYCIAVVMGDVSGHGIAAALLTSMLNVMVKNLVTKYPAPNELLYHLNNEFCKIFENGTHEMYACMFYAVIDTKSKIIYYSNAGQVLPTFIDSDENKATELEASGLPVGLIKDSKYELQSCNYDDGDLLFFHTDGLSDTFYKESPDEFSARLKEILLDTKSLKNPSEIIDIVLSSFYNYNATDNEKLELDDVSIVLCKM